MMGVPVSRRPSTSGISGQESKQRRTSTSNTVDRFSDMVVVAGDLVGFTDFSAQNRPNVVINVLNTLYSNFDKAVGERGLYKVS